MTNYNNLKIEKANYFRYYVDFNGDVSVFQSDDLKNALLFAEVSARRIDYPCYFVVRVKNTLTDDSTVIVKYEIK